MRRLSDQQGMTLPEVLVSVTIAMVISLATFALIDSTMRRTGEVAARVDATQRARQTMDFMTRQLRSQVCVQATQPSMQDDRAFYAVTPTSVTFFSDLSDESIKSGNTPRNPEMRQLSFENGQLFERRWVGTAGGTALNPTYAYTWPNTPTQSRLLASDISAVDTLPDGTPQIFRFFFYLDDDNNQATAPILTEYPPSALATLNATQLTVLTKVRVTFRANAARGKATDRGRIQLQDEVYSRLADPNNLLNPSPVCV